MLQKRWVKRVCFITVAIFGIWMVPMLATAQSIDIWWPVDGEHLEGKQPIKAMMPHTDVHSYNMFWQVDGGEYVPMPTNHEGYPHKETEIDFSGWNWSDNGSYDIRVIAQDAAGNDIVSESVQISTGEQPEGVDNSNQVEESLTGEEDETDKPDTLDPRPEAENREVAVWWPEPGVSISGQQPFKAMMPGYSLDSYDMFWRVGDGELVEMTAQASPDHFLYEVDLSGWVWEEDDSYTVTFVGKDTDTGVVLAESTVIFSVDDAADQSAVDSDFGADDVDTGRESADQDIETDTSQETVNPFVGESLYVDPYQDANRWADQWENVRPDDAELLEELGDQPLATWLGDWNQDVAAFTNAQMNTITQAGDLPVFVLYNIPNRDCGLYSAGGIDTQGAYIDWVGDIAGAIGNEKAVVLLEPDAVAGADCLTDPNQRYETIAQAVETLKSYENTYVYIDAGNATWQEPAVIAGRLQKAGIERADGFALNISNFITTQKTRAYGEAVADQLPSDSHFVIDTSRNGNGAAPDGEWCNPDGRAVGQTPTVNPSPELVDAYLWVKGPGGSDGECNGNLPAGQWSPELALELVRNAGWE